MPPATTEATWIICEAGDRWYRSVCRFAPSMIPPTSGLRIERVTEANAKTVPLRARMSQGRTIVFWELPVDLQTFETRLNGIVATRCEHPAILQVGSIPPTVSVERLFDAQEAGIRFFLSDLASWSMVSQAVSRYFSPLG